MLCIFGTQFSGQICCIIRSNPYHYDHTCGGNNAYTMRTDRVIGSSGKTNLLSGSSRYLTKVRILRGAAAGHACSLFSETFSRALLVHHHARLACTQRLAHTTTHVHATVHVRRFKVCGAYDTVPWPPRTGRRIGPEHRGCRRGHVLRALCARPGPGSTAAHARYTAAGCT